MMFFTPNPVGLRTWTLWIKFKIPMPGSPVIFIIGPIPKWTSNSDGSMRSKKIKVVIVSNT